MDPVSAPTTWTSRRIDYNGVLVVLSDVIAKRRMVQRDTLESRDEGKRDSKIKDI